MSTQRTIYLARTRGFCAGVRRAIDTVEACLSAYGPPVYVLHAIVHNQRVVDDFRARGVEFVEDLGSVPCDRPLIFSAHGVSSAVEREACERGLAMVIDATCPLVKRIHEQACRQCAAGRAVVLVGHREHPEIQGTLGQVATGDMHVVASPDEVAALPDWLAEREIVCLAQTTLARDTIEAVAAAIAKRFSTAQVSVGTTICYASANRQRAVVELVKRADLVLVVGSSNSSNANRLRETAAAAGAEAHLLDSADALSEGWLAGRVAVGVSAGASTPEEQVDEVLRQLADLGWESVVEIGVGESVAEFRLPPIRSTTAMGDDTRTTG